MQHTWGKLATVLQVVDEYMDAAALQDDEAAVTPAEPQLPTSTAPVPVRTQPVPISAMMASPMHASYSMAAGSYREAIASSLRSRALSQSHTGGL